MQQIAKNATKIGLGATIHEQLLPYAFPVWDTSVSYACYTPPCSPGTFRSPYESDGFAFFRCSQDAATPFINLDTYSNGTTPKQAWLGTLDELDPAAGGFNVWRVWIMVHSGHSFTPGPTRTSSRRCSGPPT
jgi:hypothetical protein